MKIAVTVVLVLHALIHLMGPAKAFGLAELPQLKTAISRPMGLAWLVAALFVLLAAIAQLAWPRVFWALAIAAALVSQFVVVSAWPDAKFGTLANGVLLVAALYGLFAYGPLSLRWQFETDARAAASSARGVVATVTEADLAPLPAPVARFLRAAGVVGAPRVRTFRLRFRGRIRGGPSEPWMPFEADQWSAVEPPTRLFSMRATRSGLPVHGYHRMKDSHATMRIKVLGAFTVVDAAGDVMDRSEAVTFLNDLCILAPAALLSPSITWTAIDDHSARAAFTTGPHTVSAVLFFDERGRLRDFLSEDRSRSSADGRSFTRLPFTTPVRGYRAYGAVQLPTFGEARWRLPDGEFTYGEFELVEIEYNPRRAP